MPDDSRAWIPIPGADQLAVGECCVIDVEGDDVAVYRLHDGFYAIEDLCTHDGGELASGEIESDAVVCPRHGARFCLRTGQALCAPAYEPVHVFPIRHGATGIELLDDRNPA